MKKDINEFDGLRPDDNALRLFYSKDTLYIDRESPKEFANEQPVNPEKGSQNPATLVFEGPTSADFLMIFRHSEKAVLFGEWGEMVRRLIENPQALNLSKEEVVLVNRELNPELGMNAIIAAFPATKVLVWGAMGDDTFDKKTAYTLWKEENKALLKVEGPDFYFSQPKSRMELLTQIRTQLY